MRFEVIVPSDSLEQTGLSDNKAPGIANIPEDSVQVNLGKPSQLWFLLIVSQSNMHLYPNFGRPFSEGLLPAWSALLYSRHC